MKNIFIAATRQNDGKTVISIGLFLVLKKYIDKIGFIKPVGQKYLNIDGKKVDKDAVLIKKICKLEDNLEDMNPIAVEEGFTRNYLDNPNRQELVDKIIKSYKKISENKELVLIEGTGHAGVGSIFDLNNAEVARILNSPVIIISIGGIGKPADEITLNLSLFKEKGVPVKGVIINKILEEKRDVLENYLQKYFTKIDLKLLGLIPFVSDLTHPNLFQICDAVDGKIITGWNKMREKIKNIVVGAMTPRNALDHFRTDSLLITPGDREDIILAALSTSMQNLIKGIVLTGGLYPHKTILDLIKKYDFPTIIAEEGTYEVASKINELVVKITEHDLDKIEIAKNLIEKNLNIEEIMK
ncbi:MAG: AAA family ATPase [Candidatus Omnitrophica bacterium]|nr:AAA family ATPase [Candidatus Omnitrophota bacterium]MCM8808952.1 AAA family ATPase [Candidatus Omnitrophota bacterium]MCM8810237.1 AAA family ATPase [Candidatus Omnitrophota bacterium]MCM8832654.1 AAA family ATPase [Candidatus Omnitrophota bacterium]